MVIIPDYLTPAQQKLLLSFYGKKRFRPCPPWLGKFKFTYGVNVDELAVVIEHLSNNVLAQKFNTVFLQKYEKGDYVKEHRDPINNVGQTVIAVFGEFTGAESTYGELKYQLGPGDVAVQPCTINGVQGHPHSVTPVLSGTRYALILNTINK